MKTIFIKFIEHPTSFFIATLGCIAFAELGTCAVQRIKRHICVKKNKPYNYTKFNGIFMSQELPEYTPIKTK